MSKSNLPKDWIAVNSSSHRDRVYYFNVKTKESSWTLPSLKDVEEATSEPVVNKKRRRTAQASTSVTHTPSTPENDFLETTPGRKKLVAKRILASPTKAPKNETPQMIALREKITKKKEQQNQQLASKANKSVNRKPSKSPSPRSTRKSVLPQISLQKESPKKKEENLTPQMKVLYEKMQKRATKAQTSTSVKETRANATMLLRKNDVPNESETDDVIEVIKSPRTLRTPRIPRVSSRRTSIIDTAKTTTTPRRTESSPNASLSEVDTNKETPDSPCSFQQSSDAAQSRPSLGRKNIGKERMDRLRRSLKLDRHKLAQIAYARKSLPTASTNTNEASDDALPDMYKNVSVRLTRLNEKLIRKDMSLRKKIIEKQTEEAVKEPTNIQSGTAVEDLVRQSAQHCMYEEMDWEPMEDEKITVVVQAVRNHLCADHCTEKKNEIHNHFVQQPPPPSHEEKKQLYIVVDTNVFLSNIPAVEQARDTKFVTYDSPIIVVPWTVIRELDYIKDNRDHTRSGALLQKARCAVNYLNKLFTSKQRIMGQKPEDVAENKKKFAVDCPDDEILQTCLQFRDLQKPVVLLSYDKNLCNKAMIHDITTLGRNDPLEKIDFLRISDNAREPAQIFTREEPDVTCLTATIEASRDIVEDVFEDTKTVIKDFLTDIVSKEMRELFGDFWENYVIIRPPWTVVSVLKCAVKHWIAAISESFSRRGEDMLKELLRTFSAFPSDGRKLKDVVYTIERCRDLAQMANTDKHANLMLKTLGKLDDLKEKISDYEMQQRENRINDVIGVEECELEQQRKADKAFLFFEAAYAHSRDICGLAAEAVGMPFSIPYQRPHPAPSLDYIKQIQPEFAANVNKLLLILSSALDEAGNSNVDHRTIHNLHQALVTFLPENLALPDELSPLDVLCCIKHKLDMLQAGLRQLQELSTQYCRLASHRRT